MTQSASVAYFTMEAAFDAAVPTYAGGLGVLAGDLLRSAADQQVPIVAVSLVHRHGYFRQALDARGRQSESAAQWDPASECNRLRAGVTVRIEDRDVQIAAWEYTLRGLKGDCSILLLDTDVPENAPEDRALTNELYGDGAHDRLCQEAVLGIGGVRLLRELGLFSVRTFHMNEGHSALLSLELLSERLGVRPVESVVQEDIDTVRRQCVFTTHTPVPAGQDRFSRDLAEHILGKRLATLLERMGAFAGGELNMTDLALRSSHYINGVGMKHGEVSSGLYPNYPVAAITNGVHAVTWTAPVMQQLFDRHIPPWRRDNHYLRYAVGIDANEVAAAHEKSKSALLDRIEKRCGKRLKPGAFTIGFARRAAAYKRPNLVFAHLDRLTAIARTIGPLQLVFGGKAHPHDEAGKAAILKVFEAARRLEQDVPVVYVDDYDMDWARALVSGVDLWLNTPQPPLEASGTSGMKAALNGVPSLSVLDGWWLEGWIEGVTGWAINGDGKTPDSVEADAHSLYDKLERQIMPMYYGRPAAYAAVRRYAIAINGSYFNTQRMLAQYVDNAYRLECPGAVETPRIAAGASV